MDRIAAALPHARKHLVPRAGHVPHLSHHGEYVAVVSDFIQSVR